MTAPDLLSKVQDPGEPLVVTTCWTCPVCDFTKRGGPPAECQAWMLPDACPLRANGRDRIIEP